MDIQLSADGQSVSSWTIPFAKDMGKQNISLLTQHYYRGDGKSASATLPNLISYPDTLLTDSKTGYLPLLKAVTIDSGGIGVPYRITETNSYYSGGVEGVSDAFASALWVLDHLFTLAQYGCSGANFHGGNGGAYTAIADNGGIPYGVRPLFYGLLLFNLAGTGTFVPVSVSTAVSGLNVTAYAIKSSSGLSVVINNKDTTNSLAVTLNCGQNVSSAKLLQTIASGVGPPLNALTNVTLQGAQVGPDGSYSPNPPYAAGASGSQVTCYVPAASAALVQIA